MHIIWNNWYLAAVLYHIFYAEIMQHELCIGILVVVMCILTLIWIAAINNIHTQSHSCDTQPRNKANLFYSGSQVLQGELLHCQWETVNVYRPYRWALLQMAMDKCSVYSSLQSDSKGQVCSLVNELASTWRWSNFAKMTQSELLHMTGAIDNSTINIVLGISIILVLLATDRHMSKELAVPALAELAVLSTVSCTTGSRGATRHLLQWATSAVSWRDRVTIGSKNTVCTLRRFALTNTRGWRRRLRSADHVNEKLCGCSVAKSRLFSGRWCRLARWHFWLFAVRYWLRLMLCQSCSARRCPRTFRFARWCSWCRQCRTRSSRRSLRRWFCCRLAGCSTRWHGNGCLDNCIRRGHHVTRWDGFSGSHSRHIVDCRWRTGFGRCCYFRIRFRMLWIIITEVGWLNIRMTFAPLVLLAIISLVFCGRTSLLGVVDRHAFRGGRRKFGDTFGPRLAVIGCWVAN